ncbi:recombinase family protein [Paenibacillus sp. P26]|nr:recombinase family protein [Paenibacillus sp. P26]UUZ90677.1 recombinase family protein [Paenibacillus sp. P25]
MSELFGYARVSRSDQNLDRQLDELRKNGIQEDHIFTDTMTGTTMDRPEFEELQKRLRKGDVVVTESLSRLSRKTSDLIRIIEDWQIRGIRYMSLKEAIDFSTTTGKFVLSVLASLSELERDMIRDRVLEGLAAARARGRVGGRPKTEPGKLAKALKLYDARSHSVREICEITGVSQSVLYRSLQAREKEQA